jgi:hypothetical protein
MNPAVGSRGGTLTAWNNNYTSSSTYTLTFSITVVLTNNKGLSFMLTKVYGPTQNDLKPSFLNELRMIACLHDIPWIILGNFNILRDPLDSSSSNPNLHYVIPFNDLISNLNLQEKA